MTAHCLSILERTSDLALPLAMGLNIGLNARPDANMLCASLDAEVLTSAVIVQCPLSYAQIQRKGPNTHWFWMGDTCLLLTDAEAAQVGAFLQSSKEAV